MSDQTACALAVACAFVALFWIALVWRELKPRPPLPKGEDLKDLF